MRLLLVNPPEYGYMEWMFRVFGSSIYKVASYYKAQGHQVEVFNMRQEIWDFERQYKRPDQRYVANRSCGNWDNEHISRPLFRFGLSEEALVNKLVEFKPQRVLVSTMFTYAWEGTWEVINIVKKAFPIADVVLGGVYPTLCPEHAKCLGAEIHTGRNQEIDFTWLDLDLYNEVPYAVDILTSIGCPNSCSYCAVHLLEGHKRICRDPYNVADEIEYYYSRGTKEIRFLDSNYMVDYENHFGIIMREVIRRGIKMEFISYGGVDAKHTNTDQLAEMKAAGFPYINIPVETTSEDLCRRWGRKLTANRWREIVRDAKRSGIDIGSFMLIGCPGQTMGEIYRTKEEIEAEGVMPVILPFTPIPGTKEFEDFEKMNIPYTLESLHPLLYPIANPAMPVRALDELIQGTSGKCAGVNGCLAFHKETDFKPEEELCLM